MTKNKIINYALIIPSHKHTRKRKRINTQVTRELIST